MTLASYGNQLHHDIVLNSHRTRNASTSPSTSPAVETSIASRPSFRLVWDYIFELLVSVYCVVTCSTVLRMDRFVLALHGFTIEKDRTGVCTLTQVVTPARHLRRSGWFMIKRVSPPSTHKNEVNVLRLLSSKAMDDPRNHTAFPIAILWSDRIIVTPMYYGFLGVYISPNFVICMAKDLIEGVAFMHEHCIAHLDITSSNILIACHPSLRAPRILLMDFEYSRQFPAGVEPLVDLPWFKYRPDQPPEGIQNINAFAFDMYNIGRTLHAIVARDARLRARFPRAQWPPELVSLIKDMRSDNPEDRPSAEVAASRLSHLDEMVPIEHEGKKDLPFFKSGVAGAAYPELSVQTALPRSPGLDEPRTESR